MLSQKLIQSIIYAQLEMVTWLEIILKTFEMEKVVEPAIQQSKLQQIISWAGKILTIYKAQG